MSKNLDWLTQRWSFLIPVRFHFYIKGPKIWTPNSEFSHVKIQYFVHATKNDDFFNLARPAEGFGNAPVRTHDVILRTADFVFHFSNLFWSPWNSLGGRTGNCLNPQHGPMCFLWRKSQMNIGRVCPWWLNVCSLQKIKNKSSGSGNHGKGSKTGTFQDSFFLCVSLRTLLLRSSSCFTTASWKPSRPFFISCESESASRKLSGIKSLHPESAVFLKRPF